jgi:tetratricopeptide (TPR) repeat protein
MFHKTIQIIEFLCVVYCFLIIIMASKLPKKEAELFHQLVSCYEKKEYKKGIRTADTILKKFPTHAETLSMKGLICHLLNDKVVAYELANKGVALDPKSYVCWHVKGLLHKSDNNYSEALNCYGEALKISPDNNNILKDLSSLQIQVRLS